MRLRFLTALAALCLITPVSSVWALSFQQLDFSLHKLGQAEPQQPTLLIVGGIQGDEPGGFNAASLIVTDYRIKHGNVWVVPNLNFKSIIRRSRGIYGDMNRKFLRIRRMDPDFEAVQKIKSIILNPQVSMILNLHDGSGFYHQEYVSRLRNPRRWGQSIIIDQAQMPVASNIMELDSIAVAMAQQANAHISKPGHRFHVKNTHTDMGNAEMEKTLTYFAIRNGKPAFGIEASKTFRTHRRAYYHLHAIEAAMRYLGIDYERRFTLSTAALKNRIDNNVHVSFFENKIAFDMSDARRRIRYVPLKKDAPLSVTASNPLVAVINDKEHYRVQYGNRHVTRLSAEYFDYDDTLRGVDMLIDGQYRFVPFGSQVAVAEHFRVESLDGYRVNVIGYYSKRGPDESEQLIRYNDIRKRFSIDKAARQFRVEVYTDERYCGMVIVDFHPNPYVRQDDDRRKDNKS